VVGTKSERCEEQEKVRGGRKDRFENERSIEEGRGQFIYVSSFENLIQKVEGLYCTADEI
jgi:hypothetical protein